MYWREIYSGWSPEGTNRLFICRLLSQRSNAGVKSAAVVKHESFIRWQVPDEFCEEEIQRRIECRPNIRGWNDRRSIKHSSRFVPLKSSTTKLQFMFPLKPSLDDKSTFQTHLTDYPIFHPPFKGIPLNWAKKKSRRFVHKNSSLQPWATTCPSTMNHKKSFIPCLMDFHSKYKMFPLFIPLICLILH